MKSFTNSSLIESIIYKRQNHSSHCTHRNHSGNGGYNGLFVGTIYDIDEVINILIKQEAIGNDMIIINAIANKTTRLASLAAFNSLKLTVSLLMMDYEDYPIDPTESVLYKKHTLYYRIGLTPKRDDLPSDLNKLPKLDSNDIICRWLGFRIGDVIRVNDEYRLVV